MSHAPILPLLAAANGRGPSYPHVGLREAIALGLVPGGVTFEILGRRIGIGPTDDAEAWPGAGAKPSRPTGPQPMTAISSSVDDHAASDLGAQQLVIDYLDAGGFERVAIVDLEGTTRATALEAVVDLEVGDVVAQEPAKPVTATAVLGVRAWNVGATGHNVGVVTVDLGAPASEAPQVAMGPTHNVSRGSFFRVPRGRVAFLHSISIRPDAASPNARVKPVVIVPGRPIWRPYSGEVAGDSGGSTGTQADARQGDRVSHAAGLGLDGVQDGIADGVSLTHNRAPDPSQWADVVADLKEP